MMDLQTCLWYFKYDDGVLPEDLKQSLRRLRCLENTQISIISDEIS